MPAKIGPVEPIGVAESGPPLGYDPDEVYGACTVSLEPEDVILMYTDGISEAMNPKGMFYGTKGVEKLSARCSRCRHAWPAIDDGRRAIHGRQSARRRYLPAQFRPHRRSTAAANLAGKGNCYRRFSWNDACGFALSDLWSGG